MEKVLHLTSYDVADLADMEDYVNAIRDGFRQRGQGADASCPTKTSNTSGGVKIISYTASLPDSGVIGCYAFSMGPEATDGWYNTVLFNSDDGTLLAIIDGGSWNPYKAGATGGVAADSLAQENISSVGVIGSGAQARAQLFAVNTVREFKTVNVYSPTRAHRQQFATEMDEAIEPDVSDVSNTEEAVRGSDILIIATEATSPVFDGDLLEPGMHINTVGQEKLDQTSIKKSKYVVDHQERGLNEGSSLGDLINDGVLSADHLYGELGSVIAGKVPGRESPDDITIFDSRGTGIETISAANLLYKLALREDRGSTVSSMPASEAFALRSFTKAEDLDNKCE